MADMMKTIGHYRIATENEWLFADDTVGGSCGGTFTGDIARGGNLLFQILTDEVIADGAPCSLRADLPAGVTAVLYQLIPTHVSKNSAPRGGYGVTGDYEAVRDFVTKKAPFDVYDATVLPEDGKFIAGRAAFAIRLTASASAPVGSAEFPLTVSAGDLTVSVPVRLTVHRALIPPLAESALEVCNWIYPATICKDHNLSPESEEFERVYRNYLTHLLDIRTNQLQLNLPVCPVCDETGKIVGFDFSLMEKLYIIACEMGFTTLISPFVAHWKIWTDPDIRLLWNMDVDVTSAEGYRQLGLYFTGLYQVIEKNGWKKIWWQSLVDEPQIYNTTPYRVLCSICRRFMPDLTITDPVEAIDIGGGPDVWCVKQSFYEKHYDEYRFYQDLGIRMTYYTCGFPAGDTMNRVLDLPLFVGRLTFWMCHRYGFEGFLHWGYHLHTSFEDAVDIGRFPAGNAFIVYPWGDSVCETVRSFNQLAGTEDWELLAIIKRHDPIKAGELILRGCRTFDDYEHDPAMVEAIRRDILLEADKYWEE